MSTLHLVLCAHPMADFYIKELVEGFHGEEHLIIETYIRRIVRDGDLNIIRINTPSPIGYIWEIRKVKKEIDVRVKTHDRVIFYIPHPTHLLSNYAASLAQRWDHVEICLIPDGVMNFLPYQRNYDAKTLVKKFTPKLIAGFLCGFLYRPYRHSVIGIEGIRYRRMYSTAPAFALVPPGIEVEKIEVRGHPFDLTSNAVILGQPGIREQLPAYLSGLQKAVEDSRFNCRSLYYRPHPAEQLSPELQTFLARNKIQLDTSQAPLERNNTYGTVIAYTSSALMNLRLLDKRINCYALSAHGICDWSKPWRSQLRAAFSAIGVQFIE